MNFEFSSKDLKKYPHFDRQISPDEIKLLVNNPEEVSKHKFYPFILYHDEWQPFRTGGNIKPDRKSRPIRYAARRDAYIFTHYRRILSEKYEEELSILGISHCPIAYRKIKKSNGKGKCNIDFAKDAFDEIERKGNCIAISLDIKGFFENLDHEKIKEIWNFLLKSDRLPSDHFSVFKNITKYHFVIQKELYERLGFAYEIDINGYKVYKYPVPYDKMPKQLCNPKEFREKICGYGSEFKSIIYSNSDKYGNMLNYGIPQGAPISDLIANFYLIHFDNEINSYISKNNGRYMRYSDDILIIVPECVDEEEIIKLVCSKIEKYGENLEINNSKTCVVRFYRDFNKLNYKHIKGPQGKNGFEYLGFRFDGKYVYIRDSTISRFYRKLSVSSRIIARRFAFFHHEKSAEDLCKIFNYSKFSQRFSRVSSEELIKDDYRTWTFYSYVKRSIEIFGPRGKKIPRQVRNFEKNMHKRISKSIRNAVLKRDTLG